MSRRLCLRATECVDEQFGVAIEHIGDHTLVGVKRFSNRERVFDVTEEPRTTLMPRPTRRQHRCIQSWPWHLQQTRCHRCLKQVLQ